MKQEKKGLNKIRRLHDNPDGKHIVYKKEGKKRKRNKLVGGKIGMYVPK